MNGWVYIHGKWMREEEATISVLDLSVLRGYGVNDYMRTYGRQFFKLQEHILRFQRSAQKVGLEVPITNRAIATIIEEAKEHVTSGEISLKLILTGGISPDQFSPMGNSTFFVTAYPFTPFPDRYFIEGIKVITECYTRPIPQAKSIDYLHAIVAIRKAQKMGAIDVLFHNEQGCLLEATTANFFAVKGKRLITPPASCVLQGLTRQIVLKLAKKLFTIVEEKEVYCHEIPLFDGAFLTSSTKEVMPISQINEHVLPIPEKIGSLMKEFAYCTTHILPPMQENKYESLQAKQ